jgi:hypothetical protein
MLWHIYLLTTWRFQAQDMAASEQTFGHLPTVISQEIQQNSSRTIWYSPYSGEDGGSGQNDKILRILLTRVATSNIIKLYKQMTETRVHAEKNCRKILRLESNYSPTIQMWYDLIHVYLQLIRMKERNAKNIGNILWFAQQQHIEHPDQLTMEALKVGLQLVHIWKADLRQQAKGLRKVHLQDCLIEAQTNRQHKRVAEIKQRINCEESKRMWYLIKRMVKDPHSPSVLRVQQVVEGEVKEFTEQEEVEYVIQRKCKIPFHLLTALQSWKLSLGKDYDISLTRLWQDQS